MVADTEGSDCKTAETCEAGTGTAMMGRRCKIVDRLNGKQKHNTGDTHNLPLLYQEKMDALKDILETSRLVELAGYAAILGCIASTILGYMTYISLIADINNARPENRISTFTQYPWKPFVVYFRHARLFPDDKVLRKGFIVLGLVQITSVTGFFTALRYGFHL